jgi:hypothetical protein
MKKDQCVRWRHIGRGWGWCLFLLIEVGCSSREVSLLGDAAQAEQTLAQALEAWKAGKSLAEFRAANPHMLLADEDWNSGRTLQNYEIVAEPVPHGGHWRVPVQLQFGPLSAGKALPSRAEAPLLRAYYAVTLGSKTSILRSDFLE